MIIGQRYILPLLLVASANLWAQTWDRFAPEPEGELSSEPIVAIEGNGIPWLAYVLHANGLSRFNGFWEHSADTYGAGARSEHANNLLYFDPNGGLWIGRTDGLYFVSPLSLDSAAPRAQDTTQAFFGDTGSFPVVTAIYRDRGQTLWIGTRNFGLFRFPPTFGLRMPSRAARRQLSALPCLGNNVKVADLVQDANAGYIWVATTRGVIQIDSKTDTCLVIQTHLSDKVVNALWSDETGRVWAATNAGLYVARPAFSPALFEEVCTIQSCTNSAPSKPRLDDVIQDHRGDIWAISARQIFRYKITPEFDPDTCQVEVFPCKNEWPAQVVEFRGLAADRAGFVWAASETQGILRYNMLWETIDLAGIGLNSNVVSALSWNPYDSSLYVGTNQNGGAAKRDRTGNWHLLEPVRHRSVYKFLHQPDDYILMSTNLTESRLFGLRRGMPVHFFCNIPLQCPIANAFHAMILLPDSTLWLAGDGGELVSARLDSLDTARPEVSYTEINNRLGLPFERMNALLLQDNAFVWIGASSSGLVRYNVTTGQVDLRLTNVGKAFPSRNVQSLHLENSEVLWIGTSLGLTRLEAPFDFTPPKWIDVSPTNAEVNFIFSSTNGDIWFDAVDGVSRFNQESGVTTYSTPQNASEIGPRFKDLTSGLSMWENNRESFWFGSDSGLAVFHGDLVPPETRIVEASIGDEIFPMPHRVVLSVSALFVEYEGRDNATPRDKLYFRTWLERAATHERISFKDFSRDRSEVLGFKESGEYHYFVQARDQAGNLDQPPACLVIVADLDAPSVVITDPAPLPGGAAPWVRGNIEVRGSIIDADLAAFAVEVIHDTAGIIGSVKKERDQSQRFLPALRDTTLATFQVAEFNEQKLKIIVTAIDTLAHLRRDSVFVQVDSKLPELNVLRPENFTQVDSNTLVSFRFRETNHNRMLRYFTSSVSGIQEVKPDFTSDSTFSALISVPEAPGDHTIIFLFQDLADNLAQDTLILTRVTVGVSNRSEVRRSHDGLAQVHLPPGKPILNIRISPLDSSEYFDDAISSGLQPHTRAYRIEPREAFGREATLTIEIPDTLPDRSRLGVYRRESLKWQVVGGRLSSENGRSLLRTVINRGGTYLVATGDREAFQPGDLTCQPRMFSPGQEALAAFTDVMFTLDKESPVSIRIYNTAGRQMRRLTEDEMMPPGRHAVRWDGYDNDRRVLRSGAYIVVVKTTSFTATKTVVIQK